VGFLRASSKINGLDRGYEADDVCRRVDLSGAHT
jgi:hypothetical protein